MEYWNPYESWDRRHLETKDDFMEMVQLFMKDKPIVGGGDTETNGLHIKKATPFLIIFGWLLPKDGRVFTFKPTPTNMKLFFKCAEKLKAFVWWNTN